mmetsp:Transcript_148482/g.262153  ORF Transcript_148482/g.262153 Transcript_148482/m.262153 type:complete len:281 (+) Transcript_148482:62-904(+)
MLDMLVEDSLKSVLFRLSVKEVAALAPSNLKLRAAVLSNSLWQHLCRESWKGKQVLRRFKALCMTGNAQEALRQSLADSHRTRITKAELLSIAWSARLKAAADHSWRLVDPWWQGDAATRIHFEPDGFARIASGALIDPGHSSFRWRFKSLSQSQTQTLNSTSRVMDHLDRFSRFSARGVQAESGGRQLPMYVLRRHKQTWGWVMESCWFVWSSWPMPLRGTSDLLDLDDNRLPVTLELQKQQAEAFHMGWRHFDRAGVPHDSEDEIDLDDEVVRLGEEE